MTVLLASVCGPAVASSAPNLVRHQLGGDHGSAPRRGRLGAPMLVQIWVQQLRPGAGWPALSSTSFVEQQVDFAAGLFYRSSAGPTLYL